MSAINEYVAKIPEIYQRIYRHPEYDDKSSRVCDDREKLIVDIVRQYQEATGEKAVRVIDIGCAQGYYCFKLAELGCSVCGIDFNESNIDLCRALNEESGSGVDFQCVSLSDSYVEMMAEFDIVILLNVVHHITYEKGFLHAKNIIELLSHKTKILLSELALKEEPVYWSASLPDLWEHWVDGFLFFRTVDYFQTHLSSVVRPFIFCSNQYVLCNKKLFSFKEVQTKAFKDGIFFPFKKIYHDKDILIKYSRKSGANNSLEIYNEFAQELDILQSVKATFFPAVVEFEKNDSFIISVFKINRGVLLYDLLKEKMAPQNKDRIIMDILDNLVELESLGLYHNDLRSWNIVVTDGGHAFLIDIGAISKERRDCASFWFGGGFVSVYDGFMTFVFDLLNDNVYPELKTMGSYFIQRRYLDESLPVKYIPFFLSVASMNDSEQSFVVISQLFQEIIIKGKNEMKPGYEFSIIRNQLNKLENDYYQMRKDVYNEKTKLAQVQDVVGQKLQLILDGQQEQTHGLQEQTHGLQEQTNALNRQLAQVEERARNEMIRAERAEHKIQTLYGTISWKVTIPLRVPVKAIKYILKRYRKR